MRVRLLVATLVSIAAVLTTSAPAQKSASKNSWSNSAMDPVTVGPTVYRVVLDNERVRVLEARFQPGQKIGPHSHPDHVVVVTSAGKLTLINAEGTQELDGKAGDTFYISAGTHSAENTGTTEFVCVVTELKGKFKSKGQASPKPGVIEVQQGKVDG
jgi:quercetin dioxygenase-like cupin family protein